MPDKPDFAALEKNAPQFKPPAFDLQVDLIAAMNCTSSEGRKAVRQCLQAAFMDGVIAALKDRARAQGIDLP